MVRIYFWYFFYMVLYIISTPRVKLNYFRSNLFYQPITGLRNCLFHLRGEARANDVRDFLGLHHEYPNIHTSQAPEFMQLIDGRELMKGPVARFSFRQLVQIDFEKLPGLSMRLTNGIQNKNSLRLNRGDY